MTLNSHDVSVTRPNLCAFIFVVKLTASYSVTPVLLLIWSLSLLETLHESKLCVYVHMQAVHNLHMRICVCAGPSVSGWANPEDCVTCMKQKAAPASKLVFNCFATENTLQWKQGAHCKSMFIQTHLVFSADHWPLTAFTIKHKSSN